LNIVSVTYDHPLDVSLVGRFDVTVHAFMSSVASTTSSAAFNDEIVVSYRINMEEITLELHAINMAKNDLTATIITDISVGTLSDFGVGASSEDNRPKH
jgi:hypothetical protein